MRQLLILGMLACIAAVTTAAAVPTDVKLRQHPGAPVKTGETPPIVTNPGETPPVVTNSGETTAVVTNPGEKPPVVTNPGETPPTPGNTPLPGETTHPVHTKAEDSPHSVATHPKPNKPHKPLRPHHPHHPHHPDHPDFSQPHYDYGYYPHNQYADYFSSLHYYYPPQHQPQFYPAHYQNFYQHSDDFSPNFDNLLGHHQQESFDYHLPSEPLESEEDDEELSLNKMTLRPTENTRATPKKTINKKNLVAYRAGGFY